jgi:hypothetical protein
VQKPVVTTPVAQKPVVTPVVSAPVAQKPITMAKQPAKQTGFVRMHFT